MEKPIRNRRRQYIINKPVQKRIIFTITFIPVAGLVGATLAVAVLAGKVLEEARSVAERLKALEPSFRIGSFVSLGTVYRAHRETIEVALREAGLPE